MGGMIAQHVALRHRSRVRGLVLLATTPGLPAGTLPDAAAIYRLLSVTFGGRHASSQFARLLLPRSKWHRAKEIFRDWPHAMRDHPTTAATVTAHLFAAVTHSVGSRLSRIDCPVLVAAGEDDELIPKQNSETLARRLPRAELELLPDTGHGMFAEDRDLVRRLVTRLEGMLDRRRDVRG
jgi:pimeloyl-ACP methyl ester carboxylesterase